MSSRKIKKNWEKCGLERYKSQTGATASTSASTLATELVSLEEEIKKLQSKQASLFLENERLPDWPQQLKIRIQSIDWFRRGYDLLHGNEFSTFFGFLCLPGCWWHLLTLEISGVK